MRRTACAATRGALMGAVTSGLSGRDGSFRTSSSEMDGESGSSVHASHTAER